MSYKSHDQFLSNDNFSVYVSLLSYALLYYPGFKRLILVAGCMSYSIAHVIDPVSVIPHIVS